MDIYITPHHMGPNCSFKYKLVPQKLDASKRLFNLRPQASKVEICDVAKLVELPF